MSTLILTGPPGAGRITIADHIAQRLQRSAVVDVDRIRRMIVNPDPHGNVDDDINALTVNNASDMVSNFVNSGFDVIMLDVLTDEGAELYRTALADTGVTIVLVLPSEEEVASRLVSRPEYLSRGEPDELYAQQSTFTKHDAVLDNTGMTADQAAEWLLKRWKGTEA